LVTRERITRAQQMMRAVTDAQQRPGFQTKRSLIEIGLDVGYSNPSHFAQVFRKVVGVTPTNFRAAL
jgi:AraC family transcriptional regulator